MSQNADLLITNAHILTMDRSRPQAQAIALYHDRIAFVGSNEEARSWGAGRVIDAQGCSLLPGLIDSHFHLEAGSLHLAFFPPDQTCPDGTSWSINLTSCQVIKVYSSKLTNYVLCHSDES